MAKEKKTWVTIYPNDPVVATMKGDYFDYNNTGRVYIEFGKETEVSDGILSIIKDCQKIVSTNLKHREDGQPPQIVEKYIPLFTIEYRDKAEKRTQQTNEAQAKEILRLRKMLAEAQGRDGTDVTDPLTEDADGEVQIDNDDTDEGTV